MFLTILLNFIKFRSLVEWVKRVQNSPKLKHFNSRATQKAGMATDGLARPRRIKLKFPGVIFTS